MFILIAMLIDNNSSTHSFSLSISHSFIHCVVYFGKHAHIELLNQAFSLYSISNPLHPDIWPSVMKFESEIIAMTINLVNGSTDDGRGDVVEGICGTTTSVSVYYDDT